MCSRHLFLKLNLYTLNTLIVLNFVSSHLLICLCFFFKKGVWIMNSAVHEQGQTVIKKKRETTVVPHAANLKLVLCVSIDSLFHLPIFTGSVFLSLCWLLFILINLMCICNSFIFSVSIWRQRCKMWSYDAT